MESKTQNNTTTVWKLRHTPTGLFYQPGLFTLSKRGKTYSRKPNLKHIFGINKIAELRVSETMKNYLDKIKFPVGTHKHSVTGDSGFHVNASKTDFEIVELKMI